MSKRLIIALYLTIGTLNLFAQRSFSVSGVVADVADKKPIEFATVATANGELWSMTDEKGHFLIKDVPQGICKLRIQCLGYATRDITVQLDNDVEDLKIMMETNSLKLDEVTVTARRKQEDNTTSYLISRNALDNQQLLNLSDIAVLLPGGKTTNSTLMNDRRLSLRSGDAEKGNAAFGTAIEMDGVRLQNNAMLGETTGVSTRNISSTNIESVEVVPGIPSVEYGDLSNGIVRVRTRRGKTPFVVDMSVNPYTTQIGVSKGVSLGRGVLNSSFEHARSTSDQASPYTSYQRNTLSLNYQQRFGSAASPILLNIGMNGNFGGMNSKSDPDAFNDVYSKSRDYAIRGNFDMKWLLNKSWITNLQLLGSFAYSDKKSTRNVNASSSSAQPYIHSQEQGYFIATDYDENPSAPVILGPTGYWYVKSYHDSKPLSFSLKLKADWTKHFANEATNRVKLGSEWTSSGNEGKGTYYDNLRYAPTWREYRYDLLPRMHNYALYAEDRLSLPLSFIFASADQRNESMKNRNLLQITAGLRADITSISQSQYGTASSLSPRFNLKYTLWENRDAFVQSLSLYGGWGKSVKLPSFEVLYPSPSYADRLAFSPGSTADGRAFYAYNTVPFKAQYNENLKWQYTHQTEIGTEVKTKIAQVNVAFFRNKTFRPYIATSVFSPYSYLLTTQSALEGSNIPSEYRTYTIDRETGVVTVGDTRGLLPSEMLTALQRKAYNTNTKFVNGSPATRSGLDFSIDFNQIKPLRTSLRLDGNYYHYKGVEQTLIASLPSSAQIMQDGQPYQYVGYYRGSSVYDAGSAAYATAANGSLSDQVNLNLTVTTHIPRIRLIISLRIESSLYDYRRSLSESNSGSRGVVLQNAEDYFGTPYDGTSRNQYVAVYPEYYSTWDNPSELIPFEQQLRWAYENDKPLFDDLTKLIVKTNYNYNFNPDRISAYWSANLNVTKEIGKMVSVSFLANNFLNSLQRIKSSRTGLHSTIFNSGYISPYYYGLSVRLKI